MSVRLFGVDSYISFNNHFHFFVFQKNSKFAPSIIII